MKFGFVFAFVFLFLAGSFVSASNDSCAKVGEHYSFVYKNQYPEKCCEGLTAWDSGMDTRIVQNGTCVSRPGMVAGNPVGTCLACGDGVCDKLENVCNCEADCAENKTFNKNKIFNLSNGRKAEIKIMPETASERAIERLGQLNFSVVLKEVGNNQTAYELTAEKEGKMLGVFKIKGNVSVEVDAETGEVLKMKKPWWAFLATGI